MAAHDGPHRVQIAVLAGEGGIQIDQVQVVTALRFPAAGKGGGIGRVHRFFLRFSLSEPDDLALHKIDGGEQNHAARSEVAEDAKAHGLTLFRMELHGRDMVSRRAGGESFAVRAPGGDDGAILRNGVVGVDEVNVGLLRQAAPERSGWLGQRDLIPANLRDLQRRGGRTCGPCP